jgi:hypothetical protein
VLEGGYSIEGALPYVNVGIILAMAGIDYCHVSEPDYNAESLRQTPDITADVKMACQRVMQTWKNREATREKLIGTTKFAERRRSIFYDTDGFYEIQYETLQLCNDCSGALKIDSRVDRGAHVLAVHIPHKACPHASRWQPVV